MNEMKYKRLLAEQIETQEIAEQETKTRMTKSWSMIFVWRDGKLMAKLSKEYLRLHAAEVCTNLYNSESVSAASVSTDSVSLVWDILVFNLKTFGWKTVVGENENTIKTRMKRKIEW